jgi:thymidylate synthase
MDQTVVAGTLDEALCLTLEQIVNHGTRVDVGGTLSIASGRTTYEVLNYTVRVVNPRRRLPVNSAFSFSGVAAVARFVWMMSGSDRINDISFYQPHAAAFSDDGLTIPGSCYGRRFLSPRPGLNQMTGVIDRLREDPNSRRAFMSIFQPEDSARVSRDIPCLLTLGYHVRDRQLCGTTIMRANNAYSLFAYNFFEFSLLAEIIASELGIELGPLTHTAISMHVYKEEMDSAKAVVQVARNNVSSEEISVPQNALAGLRKFIELEPLVRTLPYGLNRLSSVVSQADKSLSGLWHDMFRVLVVHALVVSKNLGDARTLSEEIGLPWARYLHIPLSN